MRKKKVELNFEVESHVDLIEGVVIKAFNGIKVEKVNELKELFTKCESDYYTHLKLRYLVYLGSLGMTYRITKAVEYYVQYCLHDLLQQVPAHLEPDCELNIEPK